MNGSFWGAMATIAICFAVVFGAIFGGGYLVQSALHCPEEGAMITHTSGEKQICKDNQWQSYVEPTAIPNPESVSPDPNYPVAKQFSNFEWLCTTFYQPNMWWHGEATLEASGKRGQKEKCAEPKQNDAVVESTTWQYYFSVTINGQTEPKVETINEDFWRTAVAERTYWCKGWPYGPDVCLP